MGLRPLGHRTEAALIGPRVVTTLKLGFLAWAAIELLQGDWGDAAALVAMFLVLLVPRLLRLPWVFDGAFVVAWTLQALGQVAGFWGTLSWWDTLVHAALPAVLAPTALILLTRLRALPDPFTGDEEPGTWLAIVLMTFMVAGSFGALYEIYEWFMDSNFGTHYQPSNSDTMTDITANAVGGVVGGIWLAGWSAWRAESANSRSEPPCIDLAGSSRP
ncbi:MAG TPA: hypothetical protein VD761_00095 [Solirubrobacterales bacterium]|nr:hypothetical protein [Solirubrobacterales bacterium]